MRTKILTTTALVFALSAGSAMAQGAFNPEANAGAEANSSATAGAAAGAVAGAEGGNASVTNRNTNVGINAQKQGQGQEQGQSQGQGQEQYQGNIGVNKATGSGNSTDVTVEGDDYEAPAFAPALSALTGTTCMGSTSASGGWVGGAIGLGTTWTDEECQRREAMKLLGSLPEGTEIRGVSVGKILGEMSRGLTGVPGALAAIKNEGNDGTTTPEQEGTTGQARDGGNPPYCTEDSLASKDTILDNCKNGEALVAAGAGSLF
jgi:hypothetical protein